MNKTKRTVLVADDERDLREPLAKYLRTQGFQVFTAADGVEALEICKSEPVEVVLTDMRMPRMNGLELTREIRLLRKSISVLIFTAYGTIETAVEALKCGAFDYALKPVIFEDIKRKVEFITQANESGAGDKETSALDSIIGESPPVLKLKETIKQVARVDSSVVIQGESGSGKELVARALHENSPRNHEPFVAVNCAAIPEQLLESELFGYKKGAFTGANTDKKGFFELATKGTILLDEIADLPLALQAKLLRALENKEVYPVGADKPIFLDARVLAASGKPLVKEVMEGNFREDLYYRIAVIEIHTPPLRERVGDVQLLAKTFLKRMSKSMELQTDSFSDETLRALGLYSWPGNIRELRNVVERAAVLCSSHQINLHDLPDHLLESQDLKQSATDLKSAKRGFERDLLIKTLASCNDDKKQAAQLLGIGLSSLYRKMEELGIED